MLAHTLVVAALFTAPPDGRQIIRAMHDRYAGAWYRTLSFVQRNTATRPDGTTEHSVWREYAALPGKLRIEFTPADSGNGILFVNDSQFVFHADTIASASAFIHPLMVLGFDVYFDAAERTVARLERLGFDLAAVRDGTWQGRPAYVVGAKGRRFWVDRERLVFVRLLEPGQRDTTRTSDIRFNKYQPAGGAWISAEVAFLVDGRERWLEEYTEIRTGDALPDALFDPRRWATARH